MQCCAYQHGASLSPLMPFDYSLSLYFDLTNFTNKFPCSQKRSKVIFTSLIMLINSTRYNNPSHQLTYFCSGEQIQGMRVGQHSQWQREANVILHVEEFGPIQCTIVAVSMSACTSSSQKCQGDSPNHGSSVYGEMLMEHTTLVTSLSSSFVDKISVSWGL